MENTSNSDTTERVRRLLSVNGDYVEKKMFGGVAFMVEGKMVICTNKVGDIMLKLDPKDVKNYISTTAAKEQLMGKRVMKNWLTLDYADIQDESTLEAWVLRALDHLKSSQ